MKKRSIAILLTLALVLSLCAVTAAAGEKAEDKAETIYEIADLAYHVLVLMVQMGISVEEIRGELASRHIIDHKVKQEKMTK